MRARGRCEGGKEVPERYVQASLLLVWPSPYLTALLRTFTPHTQDGVRVDDCSLWISQIMALPCARIAPADHTSPHPAALLLPLTPHTQDGVRVDDRSLWISQMMALPCARISPLLYPRLLPIFGALTGAEHMEQLPDGVVSVGRCGVLRVCGG